MINGVNKDALSFLNTKNVSDKGIDDVANTLNNYLGPFKIAFDHTYSVYLKVLNEVRKSITAESVLTVNHLRLQRVREYIVRYYWNYLKEVVFRNEKSFYQIVVQYLSAINLVEKLYDINVDFTEGFYTSSTVTEPQPCVRIEFKHPTNDENGSTTTYIWDKRNLVFPLRSLKDVKFEEKETSNQKNDKKITEAYLILPKIRRSKVMGLPKGAELLGLRETNNSSEILERRGCSLISRVFSEGPYQWSENGWVAYYDGGYYYFPDIITYANRQWNTNFDAYVATLNKYPNLKAFETKIGPKAAYVAKNFMEVELLRRYLGVGNDDKQLGGMPDAGDVTVVVLIKYKNLLVNAALPFIKQKYASTSALEYAVEAVDTCIKHHDQVFSRRNRMVCLPVILLIYNDDFYTDLRSCLPGAQNKKDCDKARQYILAKIGE